MTAPESQTWTFGQPEPDPIPGWEFETVWELDPMAAVYTRQYTRPVIKHTQPNEVLDEWKRQGPSPGALVRHKEDTHLGTGVILNRPWSEGRVPCWFPDGPHQPLPFIPYRYCAPEKLTVVRDDWPS